MTDLQIKWDLDTVCSLLGNEYRRRILRCLERTSKTMTRKRLINELTDSAYQTEPIERTDISLSQIHLPKLAAEGVIYVESNTGGISLTEDGERLLKWLDVIENVTRQNPADDNHILSVNQYITEPKECERELQGEPKRLDEFAAVLSHDLRNPLNVAKGHLELAQDECESEYLDAVDQAHDRMESLIDDLLTLARVGNQANEVEILNLAEILRNSWRNVDTDEAILVTETDLTIRADSSRLQQMLENLIRNAVEHGSDGVTVTVGNLNDTSGFYVEDDGPGISEEERRDVFESGYSTAAEGTGFGLSIVKEIAEAHDWEVRVSEGAHGGARFEIIGVETMS